MAENWLESLPELPTAGLQSLFGEEGIRKSTAKLESGGTIRRRVDRRRFVRLGEIKNAAAALGSLPDSNESIHAVMNGLYDGFAIVSAVLELAAPATIARLTIGTLGFNRRNADELLECLDAGSIGACTLVVSNYFRNVDAELFGYIEGGLRERGQRCAVLRSHAKLLLFEMTNGAAYVWESSANLRSCRNAETFVLSQSRELLDFHAAWLEELIHKADTEAKS